MNKRTVPTTPLRDEELTELRQRVRELEQALEQRKHTEETLTRQVAMLQERVHLLDLTHDALVVHDLAGTILFWNATAEQIYGWSREKALGKSVHALLQTELPSSLAEIEAQLLQTGVWSGDLIHTSRDGTRRAISSHWVLRQQLSDQRQVVIEVNRDITERRQAEMELRASEQELRALFAAIMDVILVFDRDGYYRKIAPTNPRLPQKPPDEWMGKRLHEVLPPAQADFFLTIIRRALEARQVVQTEYPMQIGDREFWFSGAVSPISDDAVVWVGRDITERRRIDQEQVRLREQIIRTQAALQAEASTPLILLNEQVLVMPIIGVIDQQRAQVMLSTLLEGVSSQRAAVVIVDITGVPQIDTQVANTLIQAANNLKLLDAQMILTGMRAELAQTLVTLGIDLDEVITRSTLQSGIAYALNQYGDHPDS